MTMIRYVVFTGNKGVGKTYAANYVRNGLHVTLTSVNGELVKRDIIGDAFYAPLKHLVATMLGDKFQYMDRDKPRAELQGYSVREFMVIMHMHMKHMFGDDILGRSLVHRSLRGIPKPTHVIIDDGVNADDIATLTKPFVIYLTRPGHFRAEHETDLSQIPHDLHINNMYSPRSFTRTLDNVISDLLGEPRRAHT